MSKRSKNKSRKKPNQTVREDQTKSADLTQLVENDTKENDTKENDKQNSPISKRFYSYIAEICYVLFGVAGIVAAYFTWATYMDSRPPQVSILFGYQNEQTSEMVDIDTDETYQFYILTGTNGRCLYLEHFDFLEYPGFPIIINNTNRTIRDFRLSVQISHEHLICDSIEIDPDFKLIDSDSIWGITNLLYKNNTLYPGQKVATPIYKLKIPPKTPFSKDKLYSLYILYRITYDGMSNNKSYIVYFHAYFDDGLMLRNTEEQIDQFLDYCYTEEIFKEHYVAICQSGRTYPVKLKKGMKKIDFEKYKKQIISNIKTGYEAHGF